MKGLSFITQFKIEFLLPLTRCRRKLGKMAVMIVSPCTLYETLIPKVLKLTCRKLRCYLDGKIQLNL